MPLDVDRIAEALVEITRGMLARELEPLRAANADLVTRNEALVSRVTQLEARDIAAELRPAIDGIAASVAALPGPPDLSGYATKEDVEALTSPVVAIEPEPLPDVAGMVEAAVRAAVDALPPVPDLSGEIKRLERDIDKRAFGSDLASFVIAMAELPTKADVAEAEAAVVIPEPVALPDLSEFATKAEVAEVRAAIPEPVVMPEPPDLSGFATKDEVSEVRASIPVVPEVDLSGYATKADLAAITIPEPIPGTDGAGISETKLNDDGELIIKLTTGDTFNVGKVRGNDGLGFEDMSLDWDGERRMQFTFTRGDRTEVTSLVVPAIIDRGVWREGAFERGDAVTFGGSVWIAQRDTEDRPETSDAWRLAVKRGRDGKDFKAK